MLVVYQYSVLSMADLPFADFDSVTVYNGFDKFYDFDNISSVAVCGFFCRC